MKQGSCTMSKRTDEMRESIARVILHHQDPMAPIILQNVHSAIEMLGPLLAGETTPQRVDEIQQLLFKHWSDDEMNELSKRPEFALALASALSTAIARYIRYLK